MPPARDGYPHLPAGVEPGPQSSSGGSGRRWDLITTPLAFAVFAFVALAVIHVSVWLVVIAGAFVLGGVFGPLIRRVAGLRGVTIDPQPARVRRGERLQATVRSEREMTDLEVGLVLTVRYDRRVRSSSSNGSGSSTRRVTSTATVTEQWLPATIGSFGTAVAFDVPPTLPYSYEGTCVSFSWALSARRRHRSSAPQPVWVEP